MNRQGRKGGDYGKNEQVYNDSCNNKYGVHHYHFQLLALDISSLGLSAGSDYSSVEAAANQHVIEKVELIGTYSR